jgi:hypothetical protein
MTVAYEQPNQSPSVTARPLPSWPRVPAIPAGTSGATDRRDTPGHDVAAPVRIDTSGAWGISGDGRAHSRDPREADARPAPGPWSKAALGSSSRPPRRECRNARTSTRSACASRGSMTLNRGLAEEDRHRGRRAVHPAAGGWAADGRAADGWAGTLGHGVDENARRQAHEPQGIAEARMVMPPPIQQSARRGQKVAHERLAMRHGPTAHASFAAPPPGEFGTRPEQCSSGHAPGGCCRACGWPIRLLYCAYDILPSTKHNHELRQDMQPLVAELRRRRASTQTHLPVRIMTLVIT